MYFNYKKVQIIDVMVQIIDVEVQIYEKGTKHRGTNLYT